jgi:UDP-GlcNAc:undecaprenyl-phosphate GlcNAc-1-phosphate transferase
MPPLVLSLILLAIAIALPALWVVRAISLRRGAFDSGGVAGQVKERGKRIPNTGGIAIFLALALPLAAALAAATLLSPSDLPDSPLTSALATHLPGLAAAAPAGFTLLACLTLLHILGLIDDRRPQGPFLKLAIMVAPAAAIVLLTDTRLLTMLDGPAGGSWLSIAITILWIVAITNAMNFIDNMDGLCAGVAAVASLFFLLAALLSGQWFVAGTLALLLGALSAFLVFNFPPATIYMGDGGSLVVGFTLAFLTVRTTFVPLDQATLTTPDTTTSAIPLHALLMPLLILAVPLYDFITITCLRLYQGKSPFVGDMQHVSHRLVSRGLSRRAAVMVLWGFTAVSGCSALLLRSLNLWQAALVGLQILVLFLILAAIEFAGSDSPLRKPATPRP